ncbi:choice-of-anchor L domain-containing protein, partial [Myroides guanonis]
MRTRYIYFCFVVCFGIACLFAANKSVISGRSNSALPSYKIEEVILQKNEGNLFAAPLNDDCIGAVDLPINTSVDCASFVSGSFFDSTLSTTVLAGCMGNKITKDVWYKFTATATTHQLGVFDVNKTSYNIYGAIYDKTCGAINNVAVACFEYNSSNDAFKIFKDLKIGRTYYVRLGVVSGDDITFKACVSAPPAAIYVNPSNDIYTVEELVKEVLVIAGCDLVSNIKYVTGTNFGGENGIGYFNKNGSDLAFDEGIILATNGVKYAMGPGGQSEGSDNTSWLGDKDLQKLLIDNGLTSANHNASVIEFDFISILDTLKFDFIFASNEYGPSFQCQYSDVFAFFLTDLTSGVVTNLAVVPGTTTPVSVTTIHDAKYQGDLTCGDSNKDYFDKYYGLYGLPVKDNPINYGGRTVPMTAVSPVVPGRKYHIKLAIADYSDSGVNSAVFLGGGSFNLGVPDLGDDMVVEGGNALCPGETMVLKANLNPNDYIIQWTKDGMDLVGENGPTLTINSKGLYGVKLEYKNVNCYLEPKAVKIEYFDEIIIEKPPLNLVQCKSPT